jgi:hypothetical protein
MCNSTTCVAFSELKTRAGGNSLNCTPIQWFSLHFYVITKNKNAYKKYILQASS